MGNGKDHSEALTSVGLYPILESLTVEGSLPSLLGLVQTYKLIYFLMVCSRNVF